MVHGSVFIGFHGDPGIDHPYLVIQHVRRAQARIAAQNAAGYWTGDVTELYRLGLMLRSVAEADTAPLKPLVDRPRPLQGYLFVALETGPSPDDWNSETLSLKGMSRSRDTYAFCAYPAEATRKDLPIYIACPFGVFVSRDEAKKPITQWPTGNWRSEWAIVD